MCNKCGVNEKHGRSGMCKSCKNEYNRQHYADNKRYYIDKAMEREQARKQRLRDLKEKTPCMDCGVNYPSYVMDFDHRENKEFDISLSHRVSEARLEAEIAKCDIVCSNCHRIRTHDRLLIRKEELAHGN